MDNFIFYPLMVLIIIGSFSQLYYYESVDLGSNSSLTQNLTSSQTLNGTSQDIELENASFELDFTMTIGLVAVVIGAVALGLIGLNVLGSGLSDFSVKIIWNGIVFYGLWTVFSIFSINAISSLPLFGGLLWFFLTLFYSLGIFNRMGK